VKPEMMYEEMEICNTSDCRSYTSTSSATVMDDVLTKRFIGNWGELAYQRAWLPETIADEREN